MNENGTDINETESKVLFDWLINRIRLVYDAINEEKLSNQIESLEKQLEALKRQIK